MSQISLIRLVSQFWGKINMQNLDCLFKTLHDCVLMTLCRQVKTGLRLNINITSQNMQKDKEHTMAKRFNIEI